MATSGIGWAAPDPEQQQIERSRLMAQQLRQQGATPLQGQMVGNAYVAPHWTQQLARALSDPLGDYIDRKTDERQKAYGEEQSRKAVEDIGALTQALQGSPARTIQPLTPNDDEGNSMSPVQVDAQGPDRQKALAIALGSKNPMVQQIGGSLVAGMLPKAPEWQVTERYNAQGQPEKVIIDKNNPTNVLPFGGAQATKGVAVNGQLVNPTTGEAIGQAIPKQPDAPNVAKDLLIPDGKGGYTVNTALVGVKKDIAKSGASNTQVSVNTATKPFLNEIGKGVGERVNADFEAARSAQATLQNVDQIEAGLKNAFVGPMAGKRVTLAQLGEVIGVNGQDTTEKLQNTRNLIQGLARQELAAAGSMKGQGQITESERGILRRAEAGEIDSFTEPELRTLTGALRKTANYRISVHNQNLDRLRKDPNAAGVVDYMTLPGAPNSVATPGAAPSADGKFKIIGVQ